jgi:hypothetical protein
MENKFLKLVLAKIFGPHTRSIGNRSKNGQVGLHQTEEVLHSKESNQQNEKATCRQEENSKTCAQ